MWFIWAVAIRIEPFEPATATLDSRVYLAARIQLTTSADRSPRTHTPVCHTSREKRRSLGPVEEALDEDAAGRTPRDSFKETAIPPRSSGGSAVGASDGHHRRTSSLGGVDLVLEEEEEEGAGGEC